MAERHNCAVAQKGGDMLTTGINGGHILPAGYGVAEIHRPTADHDPAVCAQSIDCAVSACHGHDTFPFPGVVHVLGVLAGDGSVQPDKHAAIHGCAPVCHAVGVI